MSNCRKLKTAIKGEVHETQKSSGRNTGELDEHLTAINRKVEGHERTLDELTRTLNGHKTNLEERYTQKTKTKHVRESKRP